MEATVAATAGVHVLLDAKSFCDATRIDNNQCPINDYYNINCHL